MPIAFPIRGLASQGRYGLSRKRVRDQLGEPLLPGFFFLRTDYPPSGGPLVPGRLGVEELPGFPTRLKLVFLYSAQFRGFSLLVGICARGSVSSFEGFQTSGFHVACCYEFSRPLKIDRAPFASGFSWCEAVGISGGIDALLDTVNPAEAEGLFDGLRVGHAGFSRANLVEADPQFRACGVIRSQPGAKRGWGLEECDFHGLR